MFQHRRPWTVLGIAALSASLAACTAPTATVSQSVHRAAATLAAASSPSPTASATVPAAPASPDPQVSASASSTSSPSAAATSSTRATVTPFITTAAISDGALQVAAVVGGVIENGTCTLTATKGAVTRTATAAAALAAQSTGCAGLSIPIGQLDAGVWTVRVAYSAAQAAGVSAPRTVTVEAR